MQSDIPCQNRLKPNQGRPEPQRIHLYSVSNYVLQAYSSVLAVIDKDIYMLKTPVGPPKKETEIELDGLLVTRQRPWVHEEKLQNVGRVFSIWPGFTD